jgi:hypothetical protein
MEDGFVSYRGGRSILRTADGGGEDAYGRELSLFDGEYMRSLVCAGSVSELGKRLSFAVMQIYVSTNEDVDPDSASARS